MAEHGAARNERRTRRLDPEVRRGQILAAAESLFERRDPAEVTFEEIADEAGVSRGLVHNYFGDRGGLLASVYVDVFGRLDAALAEAVADISSPRERTHAVVRRYLSFARANPGGWRMLPLVRAIEHPKVRDARLRRTDRMAAGWGAGPDARVAAQGVVAMLEAATGDWLNRGGADEQVVADVLCDLLWSGLGSIHFERIPLVPDRPPVPT